MSNASPAYAIGDYDVSSRVLSAVQEASRRTGVDFRYMMAKAAQESAFRADARAGTTSASGLYQFIDSTWLNMIKEHGREHGLGRYADQIVERVDGSMSVPNRAAREEILGLRFDPRINALMAGEFAQDNRAHLEARVGGDIGPTELYLAHFLGAAGATTFLKAQQENPLQSAAGLFPAAARANRAVFYNRATGQPRTLDEVYGWADRRMAQGMALVDGGVSSGGRPMVLASHFGQARMISAVPRPTAVGAYAPSAAWQNQVAALAHNTPGTPTPAGAGSSGLSMWTMLTASALPIPGETPPGAAS